MVADWTTAIREDREAEDDYFGTNPHSPIPSGERESFDGLDYYPPQAEYRFELPLHEHEDKATVTVGTSTGGEQDYLRWGEFRFEINGETVTLQAYKSDREDDRLWVPFRDETSVRKPTVQVGISKQMPTRQTMTYGFSISTRLTILPVRIPTTTNARFRRRRIGLM